MPSSKPIGCEPAPTILRNNTPIDVLVTDFSMPKMNGGELAKAARTLRPGLPVVLVSGYAECRRLRSDAAAARQTIYARSVGSGYRQSGTTA